MTAADLRWFAKKAARTAVASMPAAALAQPRHRSRQGALRVLTYHRFAWRHRDPFALDPERFEQQVALLAASGRAIGLSDLLAILDGRAPVTPGAVLLTIDDGCVSTLDVAAPILRRHAVPAVAFITTNRIGRPAGDGPERFLDADELAALPSYGIEIGSHAADHVSLGRGGRAALADQFARSRHTLEALLGRPVLSFAYPFGTPADHSPLSRAESARAGYRLCFTSEHGAITRQSDPLALPRIKIEGGDPSFVFDRACNGGLDAWILVDRLLNRLQSPLPADRPRSDQPVSA